MDARVKQQQAQTVQQGQRQQNDAEGADGLFAPPPRPADMEQTPSEDLLGEALDHLVESARALIEVEDDLDVMYKHDVDHHVTDYLFGEKMDRAYELVDAATAYAKAADEEFGEVKEEGPVSDAEALLAADAAERALLASCAKLAEAWPKYNRTPLADLPRETLAFVATPIGAQPAAGEKVFSNMPEVYAVISAAIELLRTDSVVVEAASDKLPFPPITPSPVSVNITRDSCIRFLEAMARAEALFDQRRGYARRLELCRDRCAQSEAHWKEVLGVKKGAQPQDLPQQQPAAEAA